MLKEATCDEGTTRTDVFRSFLVHGAQYDGEIELPVIRTSPLLPNRVIPFTKALSSDDYDQWVAFYECDDKLARLWNNPKRYLARLKKFNGVISPDFSLYRNMPLVMQQWSTYQGRALANWFQSNGIEVIPNVRFADERTYAFCFDGIEKHSTVAVGTYGCIKRRADRACFQQGLSEMVARLDPQTIVVYGAAPDALFGDCRRAGITILPFDGGYWSSKRQVTA